VLDDDVDFFGYSDRHRRPPSGVAGGSPGSTGRFSVLRDGKEIVLASKSAMGLRRGDRVRIVVGGGGGFGEPDEREADAIRADLQAGKVSRMAAAAAYPQLERDGA
jgi:N-methylhydantoinase B